MASSIDGKYIKVQGWMTTQLDLHGNELIVYAYIYSFQFKDFMGKDVPTKSTETEIPIRDFMEWTGLTKRGIIYVIQSLQDKGLITTKVKSGTSNAYSILPEPVKKALKGEKVSGEVHCTGEKIAPVQKLHQGGEVHCTTGGEKIAPGVVKKEAKSGEIIAPHLQHNYIDNKNTTSTTTRTREEKSSLPSLTETDTKTTLTTTTKTASPSLGNQIDELSTMTEEEKAQYEALQAMSEDFNGPYRPKWLRTNPMKAFPKAYEFLEKGKPHLSKMELELLRKYSKWIMIGKPEGSPLYKNEDNPNKEETLKQALTLENPETIGQEAYNAQKNFLQFVYGKDVPIQTLPKKRYNQKQIKEGDTPK